MCVPTSVTTHLKNTYHPGIDVPNDVLCNVFSFLPPPDLLEMQCTCKSFKELIKDDYPIQIRIAEFYLTKKPLHANIPLGELKYFLHNTDFTLEIKDDVNLFHLTNDLAPIIPWISTLILKNCGPDQLEVLLLRLKESKRLSMLILLDCKLNTSCNTSLFEMLYPKDEDVRVVDVYFGYIECDDLPSPYLLEDKLNGIIIISKEEALHYNIENFESQESGIEELEEFELQASDELVPPTEVLKAFDSIKDTLRAELVFSIFRSVLMDPYEDLKPIDFITRQAREYIERNPHHPAITAAIKTNKQKYFKP